MNIVERYVMQTDKQTKYNNKSHLPIVDKYMNYKQSENEWKYTDEYNKSIEKLINDIKESINDIIYD